MATPLGHSIVGYTIARAAGVRSLRAMALAVGAASLPDVDFLLGYAATGDARSLHREVITHKPVFPFIVGAATGLAAIGVALVRGRLPSPGDVLRPAALATALVGSHVVMDTLPLPYDDMPARTRGVPDQIAGQAWNGVIDIAAYGTIAMLALQQRNGATEAEAEVET